LVVGDVDEGRAEGGLQLLELDLHAFAQLEIEGAERFVEQEQGGFQHQAAGDGDALALTTRELVGTLALSPGQADALEHGLDLRLTLRSPDTASGEPVGDVLAHAHHREERQLLEHHVDGTAVGRDAAHAAAADLDVPAIGLDEARDHAQQRGLAAARGAEDGEETAALDAEGERVDCRMRAEALQRGLGFQVEVQRSRHKRELTWQP
jgi:hypothetical protein